MSSTNRRSSTTAGKKKSVTYAPTEPSVEGGQIFTSVHTKSGTQSHSETAVDDVDNNLETDPEMHSVNRGTRLQRNALVVVTESEKGAEAATCQYPGKKDQDRYTVQLSPDTTVFPHYIGMFDGHGTSVFAAELCASQMLQQVFGKDRANDDTPTPIPTDEAIVKAYRSLHDTVLDMVKKHPRTGTTAVTLFVGRESADSEVDTCKIAWAGDSRAAMISGDGKVTQLTMDHSISSNQNEMKRIAEADHTPRDGLLDSPGWAIEEQMAMERGTRARAGSFIGRREINGREAGPLVVFAHSGGVSLQVSRSIGDALAARSVLPDPEICTVQLPKDAYARFVVASDGLWDVYSTEAACRMVMDIPDPAVAARKLSLAARSKRTQMGRTIDDITVIVFDVNSTHSRTSKTGSGIWATSGSHRHSSSGEKCSIS